MKSRLLIMGILLMLSLTAVTAREWTDDSGTYTVKAEFVNFADGKVHLKNAAGKVIGVQMSRLSKADQDYVHAELKRRRNEQATTPVSAEAAPSNMMTSDWHQWRGPNRDGVSTETGLIDSWEKGAPKLDWSARDLGRGYSSVSISDGRIFTMGNPGTGEELIALSEEDGSKLWSAPVGPGKDSNCTPTVDGDLVFALGRQGDLICADVKTGEVKWKKNFGRDFGGRMMSGWGYSESPLVDGDRLICTPGGDRAMVAALNKRTGEVIWTTAMPPGGASGKDGAGYSSIVISKGGGVKQYVTLVGRGVIGVDAKTGRLLWHYPRVANGTANVPTPIVKDDYVFCSSGYGDGGSALLKLSRARGGVQYREVYYRRNNDIQNHHGGMILIGDHIYMGNGHNRGFPLCFNMVTGEEAWRPGRGPGDGSAAIVAADGNLYFRYQNGVMALIEATPDKYNLKGTFRIASKHGESWPHPVISSGKLYLRDQHELHCYDIAQ